ncbi:Holliday junction resolvase RuvX [candidate division KSB1 bacterium]|nr:Holliday junction resolvase RuvX [candidate division KSB1 bacterium]
MALTEPSQENLERLSIGRILAVDYGEKRIGLALSDPMQVLASPFRTIANEGKKAFIRSVADLVVESGCCCVVFGMPFHLHGDPSPKSRQVSSLIPEIAQKVAVPIFAWDERWTTVSAHRTLHALGESPSRNKERVDRMAAAYILQAFLDRLASVRRSQMPEL